MRCSLNMLHERYFDFWSIDTVKRTISRLESAGFLIINNFNRDLDDGAKWYTVDADAVDALRRKR